MKSLMKDLDSLVLAPTDTLVGEMRGTKKDLRAPFDRAWKDYQDKFSELERQKKRAAKEAGMKIEYSCIKLLVTKSRKFLSNGNSASNYIYNPRDFKYRV